MSPSTPPHLDIALERNPKCKKRKESYINKVYGHNKTPFITGQYNEGKNEI